MFLQAEQHGQIGEKCKTPQAQNIMTSYEIPVKTTEILINSIDDLNIVKSDNYYRVPISLVNGTAISINGTRIPAWTKFYFPCPLGNGDFFGFAVYPDASVIYIIGHANGYWFVNQLK
ncbi:MAG: hypothetical protein ACLUVC_02080 [Longibaculum sp.]